MSKTTIKIKNIWGNILYSHEAEDNSVKKALQAAISATPISAAPISVQPKTQSGPSPLLASCPMVQ